MIAVSVRKALRDYTLAVDFTVESGTCLALVGPTGCGKTTTLRLVAGLETADVGVITMNGETLVSVEQGVFVPAQRRQVGMVFQDYALFPHLTVLQNAMYGARARGRSKAQARQAALDALKLVQLEGFCDQHPDRLSGGQQQRVALARALASGARALLMDEPMSALDASTRRVVRGELRQLLQRMNLQTIIVTHDVVDALTLGDMLCVMNRGRIIQQGDRQELLSHPRDPFVAEFLGVNLLSGIAEPTADGLCRVRCNGATFACAEPISGRVLLTCNPWDIALSPVRPQGSALNVLRGRVKEISRLGGRTRVTIENGVCLTAEITHASESRLGLTIGSHVFASFKASAVTVYPATGSGGDPAHEK